MTRVLVFGTFDHLHEGHRSFLRQALEHGHSLIVCLPPDEIVERLKGRKPDQSFAERKTTLEAVDGVSLVIQGDTQLSQYACLQNAKPDIVALGYDQQELGKDLKRWQQATGDETPVIVLQPYQPEIYKSSLLRNL